VYKTPSARDLTAEEMTSLRSVVASSFTSSGHINAMQRNRLIELGLIHFAMGD
jgi:hypothetical protein